VQGELTHARDEALEALESKNQLLANISHDARTPLTVIMLRAENMERGMYGTITPRQHEVLSGIRASANQMHFFVNNLLASAKLKTGMMQLLSEPMDVKQIMKDIETLMEPLASESGIKLFVEMSADEGFTPFGDAERIKQILFNLIDNAIKFTDAGGSIRLRVVSETYRRWAISIQDTGQGIPQDELQHIFRAFYQVTQSTATKATAAGVGLGLSIVQQLTSLMEGTIEIESKVGIGTTFTIRLPTRAPKVDTREMMAIGEAAARPDVLIVQNQP
jgi:signal transduction histidine kinase